MKAGGLAWTIIRPTAYVETWCDVLGRPLLEKGKTQVFGSGRNPINWVSVSDVAGFVELAIVDAGMRGEEIDVGGPENLGMNAFVEVFQREAGVSGKVGLMPLLAMRIMAIPMSLLNPSLARQIRAGIVMDTAPQEFDASVVRRRYPSVPVTTLRDVVKRDIVEARNVHRDAPTGVPT